MSNIKETANRVPRRNFISLPEVAAERGVSRVAVLYDIRSGKLTAHRTTGRREWYIGVVEAKRYLAENPVRAAA